MINKDRLKENFRANALLAAGASPVMAHAADEVADMAMIATAYRTETAWRIIEECHPDIIRGNASEIMALINADIKSKGVDSSCSSDDAVESAKKLAARTGSIVVISGETDYVTDGSRVETIANGSRMMPHAIPLALARCLPTS